MGSPACEATHPAYNSNPGQVTLTRDFVLQDHELTKGEWTGLGFADPSGTTKDVVGDCADADCPVHYLTWFAALAYANALSELHGYEPCFDLTTCRGSVANARTFECDPLRDPGLVERCEGYRLPTEAEWEYAVRAGTNTSYWPGTNVQHRFECYQEPSLDSTAWYCRNAGGSTHPGRQKLANPWGLFDVYGNVGEWTMDVFSYYPKAIRIDPYVAQNPLLSPNSDSDARVYRGMGIWGWPGLTTSAGLRIYLEQQSEAPTGAGIGFRLARTLRAPQTR